MSSCATCGHIFLVVLQEGHKKKRGRLRKAAHVVEGCFCKRSWKAHSRYEPSAQLPRETPDRPEGRSSSRGSLSFSAPKRFHTCGADPRSHAHRRVHRDRLHRAPSRFPCASHPPGDVLEDPVSRPMGPHASRPTPAPPGVRTVATVPFRSTSDSLSHRALVVPKAFSPTAVMLGRGRSPEEGGSAEHSRIHAACR